MTDVHQFGLDTDEDLDALVDGPVDPDIDAPPTTVLDDLRSDLRKDVAGEEITLQVPLRDGWAIRCNVDVESGQLNAWRKRSMDRSMADGVDALKFACIVLAAKTTAILKNGVEAHDEDGEPLTFRHQTMLDMTGANRAVEAVKTVFGRDAHVITASFEVLRAAGYGEDMQDLGTDDPM